MKLIEILSERKTNDEKELRILKWLNCKIDEIIQDASNHLSYVWKGLPEFDRHNNQHSEKILEIIEGLLGEYAEGLSSYDLFSLVAVSYLHDCGMSVSDYEINVMTLVENEEYDGHKVCTKEQAYALIQENIASVFPSKKDVENVRHWMFYPGSEEQLLDYYADLLIDYQSYRNGKIDEIKKSKDVGKTNINLRTDYIRKTHADRAERYVRTLGETRFDKFLDNIAMGKKLADHLALVCKAHCMDADFVRGLGKQKKVMYLGRGTSNLQFVAMMLRLGDIIHFSYDRAPLVLRALHHFESDVSHEHWRIKEDSGVDYSISEDGEVSFSAYCSIPQDYYGLMSYVDYIDQEINLYNRLKQEENWESCYPFLTKNKVNRDNIFHDNSFKPVPNLKFTLEQNRILDLLMGAQLYSNEYACLRELYQNSLDACRCQLAADTAHKKESTGRIEFGIETDGEGNRYVYCLDNGKGMSQYIIENYLLKVGSSYYRSSDFYRSQAETGNSFTPTSQFGIGILSCFMIGDKIEITTREERGDYISCVMESIHECFYYKKEPAQSDKDRIDSSGTLIKIFLNADYKGKICNNFMNNIGYLLWRRENKYNEKERFRDHLYFILDGFVKVMPPNIELYSKMENGKLVKVFDKPLRMGEGEFSIPEGEDFHYNDDLNNSIGIDLFVENEGIQCRTSLVLPSSDRASFYAYRSLVYGRQFYCVDGISVDNSFVEGRFLEITKRYHFGGLINFVGSDRPQLKISRESIVKYDSTKYEEKVKGLLIKLVKQAIQSILGYITERGIQEDSALYKSIWDVFFQKFEDVPAFMVAECLMEGPVSSLSFPLLQLYTSSKMSFGDFFKEDVRFDDYSILPASLSFYIGTQRELIRSLILYRVLSSDNCSLEGTSVSLKGFHPAGWFEEKDRSIIISTSDAPFDTYDLVLSHYPFISDRLFAFCESNYEIDRVETQLFEPISTFIREYRDSVLWRRRHQAHGFWKCLAEELNRSLTLSSRFYFSRTENACVSITALIDNLASLFFQGQAISRFDSDEDCVSVILFFDGYLTGSYVMPGRRSRQDLVDSVPDETWDRLSSVNYSFIDGTPVKKSQG